MFKENNVGICCKILQVESTTQMGCLPYSANALEQNILAKVLTDEIGVKVALRYKYINTETYELNRDERNKLMATHIEVDSKYRKQTARIFLSYMIVTPLNSHRGI